MNTPAELEKWLKSFDYTNTNLLLMSSGNYDGADMLTFANLITKTQNTTTP
jgi:UDP-N-acetylmuramate: L-alanyl-gamma-D-glutamyl-meso-diaminopimelate ligase